MRPCPPVGSPSKWCRRTNHPTPTGWGDLLSSHADAVSVPVMTPFALATPKLVDHRSVCGRNNSKLCLRNKYGVTPPGITYHKHAPTSALAATEVLHESPDRDVGGDRQARQHIRGQHIE